MKRTAAAFLLLTAACSRPPRYAAYQDPAKRYTLEVPATWAVDADPNADKKPASKTEFIGAARPQREGVILGAVLSVSRLSRARKDFPGTDAAFKGFDENILKPTRDLFGDDAAAPAAKTFSRDYDFGGPTPLHSDPAVAMRSVGTAYRTADAYFVVEYRAAKENFEKYRYAYDRAVLTFKPVP